MAKCIAPAMSAECRGRIGGIIMNTWRGLRTVKIKTSPSQPRTQKQLRVRAIGITVVRLWQTLSDSRRTAWNDYATAHTTTDWTNTKVRATGCNFFLALNSRQRQAYNADVLDPPIIPAPGAVSSLAATTGTAKLTITWAHPDSEANWNVEIWIQGPHSPGAIGSHAKARLNIRTNYNAGTIDITLRPGFYTLWARTYDTTNGLVSTWQTVTGTVT
jgi:hypothetical protein